MAPIIMIKWGINLPLYEYMPGANFNPKSIVHKWRQNHLFPCFSIKNYSHVHNTSYVTLTL